MTARDHDADVASGHRRGDARADEVVIGLVVDPDLPAALADRLHGLPELLRGTVGHPVTWKVHTVHEPFEEMFTDYGRLMTQAREHVRNTVWDVVVCVTDQPMYDDSGVVVASIDTDGRVAVVSLPALGGMFLHHRLQAVVVPIIASLVARTDDSDQTTSTELRRRLPARRTRVLRPEPGGAEVQVVRAGWLSRARLLGGMVRANRPWRLLLGLSTALAGAVTGIAFGILYSSIWTLGTALGPLRLAGLAVAALTAMTVWIIVGHGLWERQERTGGSRGSHVRLRNASMLVTVVVGAVAFFLAMFAVALAAAALVIPPSYLAATLSRPVSVSDYLAIAMLATVLGTLAGAVGSGLEDDTEVLEATYGYRERERRHRAEREADSNTTPTDGFRQQ